MFIVRSLEIMISPLKVKDSISNCITRIGNIQPKNKQLSVLGKKTYICSDDLIKVKGQLPQTLE